MATKPLMTDHATVAPASIEVKVMRIGAWQMTQAVFRPLPRRKLCDEDTGRIRHPTLSTSPTTSRSVTTATAW
jgi:hypothetical protein